MHQNSVASTRKNFSDDTLDDLRTGLLDRIESLAIGFFGEPNRETRRKAEWRWNRKGSMRIAVRGAKRGSCADFDGTWTGDPIALIMREQHCDFTEAVRWGCDFCGIPFGDDPDWKPRQPDPTAKAKREAEQARKKAEQDAAAAADVKRRIAWARSWWNKAGPVDGTIGETYLKNERGIPRPAAGWPACMRFHHQANALVFGATTSGGKLQFVQLVHLTLDGQKIDAAEVEARGLAGVKVTHGVMDGAYVRLPGDIAGPLLLAEGPETGLSVWVATGHETRLSIGSITRHQPEPSRINVLCRDDDKHQSPADKGLKTALAGWSQQGHDIRVAAPWPIRRCDKTDFNDVIQAGGIQAVQVRILHAIAPAVTPVVRLSAEQARRTLRKAALQFFNEANTWRTRITEAEADFIPPASIIAARSARRKAKKVAKTGDSAAAAAAEYHAKLASKIATNFAGDTKKAERELIAVAKAKAVADVGPYPVHAIHLDVGGGKTEAALENIIRIIPKLCNSDDKRPIALAMPTHKLGDQLIDRLHAMSGGTKLQAAVWRSRKANPPNGSNTPMCFDLDAVADAEKAMANIQSAVCRKVMPDGEVRECAHYSDCLFQKQRQFKPDVWFVPHELIFNHKPEAIEAPAVLIVDEKAWQAGITGTDEIWLDSLISESAVISGDPIASEQLAFNRRRLFEEFSAQVKDGDANTPRPVLRQALLDALIFGDTAAVTGSLEWQRKIEADIYPGMSKTKRKEAVAAAVTNKVVGKFARLWKAIGHLVSDGGPDASGWISLGNAKTSNGTVAAIFLKGRREVHSSWHCPTLLIDATLQPELIRPFWPTAKVTADIRIQTPHQHVVQVIDRSYAKAQLRKPAGLRDVHAIICREARRRAPGRVLVVIQLEFELLLPGLGPLPKNVELAHHNNISGRDDWGPAPGRPGIALLIVIGRTSPSPAAVEADREALTGAAIPHLTTWFDKADAVREMADGTFRATESDRHPDPVTEAVRWAAVEGELIQILGRPRGVNRTAANPVDVLVLTNTPLPLPVDRLICSSDLDLSIHDLQMAAGGVAFERPAGAAAAYPRLWDNEEQAKKAFQRARPNGDRGTFPNKSIYITSTLPIAGQ